MVPSASARHSFGDGLPSGRAILLETACPQAVRDEGVPAPTSSRAQITLLSRDVSMATHAKDPRPQDRDGVPDPSWKTGKRPSLGFLRENLGFLRAKTSESLTIGRCACI